MQRTNLDLYDMDEFPREMRTYLKNFGLHFNKKACEEAVKGLKRKNPATGKEEPIEAKSKDEVEQVLTKYGIKLDNNVLYDFVFVYNMALSDFYKSSLADEKALATFTKDYVDDGDQADGFIFNRWFGDRMLAGKPIEWGDLL